MSGKGLTPAQILAKDKAARAANQAHLKLLYSQEGGVMSGQDYSQADPYTGTDIALTAGQAGAGTPELQQIAGDMMSGKITSLDALRFISAEAKPGGLLESYAIVEAGVNNGRDTTMYDALIKKVAGWSDEIGKADVARAKGDGTGLPNQNDTYSADNAPMSDAIRSKRQNALKAYEDAAGGMEAWDASHKAPVKPLTLTERGIASFGRNVHGGNGMNDPWSQPQNLADELGQHPTGDVPKDAGVDRKKMSKAELLKYSLDFSMGRAPKLAEAGAPKAVKQDPKQAVKDRAAYDAQRRSMRMDLNKKANDVRSSERYMAAYTKELTRLGITPRNDAVKAKDETLTNMGL